MPYRGDGNEQTPEGLVFDVQGTCREGSFGSLAELVIRLSALDFRIRDFPEDTVYYGNQCGEVLPHSEGYHRQVFVYLLEGDNSSFSALAD